MDEQERHWRIMRGAVAARARQIIDEYREGHRHGRDVAIILGDLFVAANDTIDYPRPAQVDERAKGANDA